MSLLLIDSFDDGPQIAQATAVVGTFSVGVASVVAGPVTVAATAATAIFSSPTPVVAAIFRAAATTVTGTFSASTATRIAGPVTVQATAALATFSAPTPTVAAIIRVTATAPVATFSAPTPTVTLITHIPATAAIATFSAGQATLPAPQTALATAVVGTFSVPSPVVGVSARATAVLGTFSAGTATAIAVYRAEATAALATFSVGATTVIAGPVIIGATAVTGIFTATPVAAVEGGEILVPLPTPIAGVISKVRKRPREFVFQVQNLEARMWFGVELDAAFIAGVFEPALILAPSITIEWPGAATQTIAVGFAFDVELTGLRVGAPIELRAPVDAVVSLDLVLEPHAQPLTRNRDDDELIELAMIAPEVRGIVEVHPPLTADQRDLLELAAIDPAFRELADAFMTDDV